MSESICLAALRIRSIRVIFVNKVCSGVNTRHINNMEAIKAPDESVWLNTAGVVKATIPKAESIMTK